MSIYYISAASGSDGNSGLTEALAWATVDYGMNNVIAGDTVYVKSDGNYNEKVTVDTVGSGALPISFIGYSGTIGDNIRATIDAQGVRTNCLVDSISNGTQAFYIFKNFRFTNATSIGVTLECTQLKFKNCRVDNCPGWGLYNYHTIFEDCEFDHNGDGIFYAAGHIFLGCKFDNNSNADVNGAIDNLFYGCTFFSAGEYGIYVHGGANSTRVLNSTFDGDSKDTGVAFDCEYTDKQLVSVNNIFHDNGTALRNLIGQRAISRNNLFNANTNKYQLGANTYTDEIIGVPNFVNEGANDYRLDVGSSGIANGFDFSKVNSFTPYGMDIGAFQVLGSGMTIPFTEFSSSGDLFIHGKDNKTQELDVFVHGFQTFNKDILASGQYIYWTDASSTKIERIKTDGSNREIIVSGLSLTQGIYVDEKSGKLYWVDRTTDKIQRSNLDGTNIEDIVTSGLTDPQGLFVDTINNKIYWVDATLNTIKRCDLNGSNVEIIVSGLSYPEDIFVDNINNKIYWTQSANPNDAVKRANLDGSNIETLVTGINNPEGLDLDLINNKIYFAESDAKKIKRCNLNGTSLTTLVNTTGVPVGIKIDINNNKIYWAELTPNTIKKSNLDGSSYSTVVAGLTSPQQVDIYSASVPIFTDLFVHGHETINDQLNLVLHYPSFKTVIQDLFIHGPEQITDLFDLFTKGYVVAISGINLFTHGRDILNDQMDLFVHGPEQINDNIYLSIHGTVSGLPPILATGDDNFGLTLDQLFKNADYNPQIIGRFIGDPNSVTVEIWDNNGNIVTLIDDNCYQISDTGRWAWSTINLSPLIKVVNQFIYRMTGDNLETFESQFILKTRRKDSYNKVPRDNSQIRKV